MEGKQFDFFSLMYLKYLEQNLLEVLRSRFRGSFTNNLDCSPLCEEMSDHPEIEPRNLINWLIQMYWMVVWYRQCSRQDGNFCINPETQVIYCHFPCPMSWLNIDKPLPYLSDRNDSSSISNLSWTNSTKLAPRIKRNGGSIFFPQDSYNKHIAPKLHILCKYKYILLLAYISMCCVW